MPVEQPRIDERRPASSRRHVLWKDTHPDGEIDAAGVVVLPQRFALLKVEPRGRGGAVRQPVQGASGRVGAGDPPAPRPKPGRKKESLPRRTPAQGLAAPPTSSTPAQPSEAGRVASDGAPPAVDVGILRRRMTRCVSLPDCAPRHRDPHVIFMHGADADDACVLQGA